MSPPRPARAAEQLFVSLGRLAARAPAIRGKNRVLLAIYKLLGLEGRHVVVRTRLRRPVPYLAELDLHSWLQRIAFLAGGYEDDTVRFLLGLHQRTASGGYLLDIGANIGLISLPFALSIRASGVGVFAVEAVPDNIAALTRNVELNDLGQGVRVIPFGLGERSGAVEIQVEGNLESGGGTGTANILPEGSTYACTRQTIQIRTLDELYASGELPHGCGVIKIDTDGYDLKVLQGGAHLLAQERPVIFGEFSAHCMRWHGQSLADVVSFAHAHGYDAYRRAAPAWKFEPVAASKAFNEDLLLVPRERSRDYASFAIVGTIV